MATNQAVTYEEVKAYQAKYGFSTYGAGSGGYTTGGIFVSWTTEGGFTGAGWQFGDRDSPVFGWSDEKIAQEITDKGNLDSVFKNWVDTKDYETRYNWILDDVNPGCRGEAT